jgi:polyphosphate glucokinase
MSELAPLPGDRVLDHESLEKHDALADAQVLDQRITATPERPFTLSIDVGGTGLKAVVLDAHGRLVADRVRVPTTYPLSPSDFLEKIVKLVQPLPDYERIAVGFPGVVRRGKVITAPHFVTAKGPGTKVVPHLVQAWSGYAIEQALSERLGRPTRALNDADLQGLAVVAGEGLEFVVTLGTGVGTALFMDGRLAPHLELAHHPFMKDLTYNEGIGDAALSEIGKKRWRARVLLALFNFSALINYDRCYVGGGNSRLLEKEDLGPAVTLVDNIAGLLGGIKLWETSSEKLSALGE